MGLFAIIVSEMVGMPAAGAGLGYLAWKKLSGPWWLLLVGALLGLTGAMMRLYQMSKREM